MAKKKQQLDTWAPTFGLWMETATVLPPAASTFLGMWQMDGAAVRLRDCCCYYYDADGKKVDPDEKGYTAVRYWQWEGDSLVELPALSCGAKPAGLSRWARRGIERTG